MLSTPFPSISNPGLKSSSSRKPCWLSSPLNDYPLLISILPVSITKHLLCFIYVVPTELTRDSLACLFLSPQPPHLPVAAFAYSHCLPGSASFKPVLCPSTCSLTGSVPIVLPVHNPVNPLRPGSKNLFSRNHLWPLASQRWFLPPHPLGGSGV